jgi:enoyl-CoA hydratase
MTSNESETQEREPYALAEKDGPKGYVILNRPERLNAFGVGEQDEIRAAFEELEADDRIKVIILRGKGRSFSTGHDVRDLGTQYGKAVPDGKPTQRSRLHSDLTSRHNKDAVFQSSKVTIAEGKGYVLGGALLYFLNADIMIAAEGTVFGSPPARMIGTGGGIFTMLKLGIAVSNEMQFLGRYFRAEELMARGVLNRVVPLDQLESTTEAAADLTCGIPADGLAVGKLANRIAWNMLGAEASGLVGAMSHALQVQQKLGEDEWNLFRDRKDKGAKGAWQNRDSRWAELMRQYAPDGVIA